MSNLLSQMQCQAKVCAPLLLLVAGCSEYDFIDKPETLTTPPEEVVDTGDVTGDTAVADAPVYANTSTELFEVVPETGDKVLQGRFLNGAGQPVDNFVDIAINTMGHMYGGTFDALYRIDPSTARVTLVCETEIDMTALTFTSTGTLISGGETDIHRVDINTCASSPLLTNSVFETSGDLVGLPDGYLYWTVAGADNDELVRVDPNTGSTTWIGFINTSKLFGLGYDEGELYGFSKTGEIVRISPTAATSTIVTVDAQTSWWGATTNPVLW
ncbi:MAG: hypothetical protein HN348_30510, partial [Proteobacteria bacterium]|jgi:hypothetical protein|nr:hypothetical protein [Pseudomonadota bacterium]